MVDQDADDDDLSSEEDGSHTTSCQSVDGTDSTLPKREFSEMDPGVEGNLVVWPPLKGIVTYDESFEVANVKPIKATELQEIDIDWWSNKIASRKRVGVTRAGEDELEERRSFLFHFTLGSQEVESGGEARQK